jgi:hypothetical protein
MPTENAEKSSFTVVRAMAMPANAGSAHSKNLEGRKGVRFEI